MELDPAARRQLLADDTIRSYVGDRVHLYRLEDRVDPLGSRAVVLYTGPWWAEPDRYEGSSREYPTLIVDCWADCTRDGDGQILRMDQVPNAKAVWRAVHRLVHNPPRGEVWGQIGSNPGILVDSSSLFLGVTHLEGATATRTGIPLGDAAVVTATYALTVTQLTV